VFVRRPLKATAAIVAALLSILALGVSLASATAPTVLIDPASGISYTSVHLAGKVDPEDQETQYYFQVSTDPEAEGWSFDGFEGPLAAESGQTSVSRDLTGLKPGTEYFYRLAAVNADGNTNSGEPYPSFTTDPVAAPTIAIDPVTTFSGTTAHFSGAIDPRAPEAAPASASVEAGFKVDWHFECTPACPGLQGTVAADDSSHQVEANVTGLLPGTAYQVNLVAENSAGPVTVGPKSFTTETIAPAVLDTSASPLASEATLKATIDPGGAKTDYRFEYGTGTSYGQSTVEQSLPAGTAPVKVQFPVLGLTPQTNYHYRVVATNSVDTVTGPDQSFATEAPSGSDSCSNAAIRALQGASELPECRAYELVSPPEKGGQAVDRRRSTVQSSPSGDAVAFGAAGAFQGSETSLFRVYYLANRSAAGWTTEAIDPPQSVPDSRPANSTVFFSEDLTKAIQFSRRALLPGAIENGGNLYLRNNLTGERTLIAAAPGLAGRLFGEELVPSGEHSNPAGSQDLSHFSFRTPVALSPEVVPGTNNVYEYAEGQLRVVGRLPDDAVSSEGSSLLPGGSDDARGAHLVSADGSHIVFYAGGDASGDPLYMRIDGEETIPISASERAEDLGSVAAAIFYGMSPDGEHVFFFSSARLTEDSRTSGEDLYRYDVAEDKLTDLTRSADPNAGIVRSLILSPDGSHLFFSAVGRIAGSEPPFSEPAGRTIYVAHGDQIRQGPTVTGFEEASPPTFAVSSNGRYFAFTSHRVAGQGEYFGAGCGEVETCTEVYLYDTQTDRTECLSCDPVDGVNRPAGFGFELENISAYVPRLVGDDGSVVFNSDARLLPEDVNGTTDVYRWQDGRLALISTGRGSSSSQVADVSSDGRDVFFFTAGPLVASDTDKSVDLYDARAGGGIAAQNTSPPFAGCEGDACQGPLAGPPAPLTVSSSAISAAGRSAKPGRGRHSACKQKSRKQRKKCHANKKRAATRASKNGRGN
jgi:hypothetical protein